MFFGLEHLNPRLLALVAIGVAFVLSVGYLYLRYQRYAALKQIRRRVAEVGYDMLVDVMIPDGMDGLLHIEFLLLTQRGILVLDLRETPGMIFGGDQMKEWTVMTRNRRYSFVNPQGPLLDRIAAVKQLSGDTPVEGRILFTARSHFPKGQPKSVLMLDSLKMEFAPVDKAAMHNVVERFRPDWDKVKAAASPSDLKRL